MRNKHSRVPGVSPGINWSSVKQVARSILKYESKSISRISYDLSKGVCYDCVGANLMGVGSVAVSGLNTAGYKTKWDHFLVSSNHYKVFEFPEKGHSGRRETGNFFAMFFNLQYDYCVAAELRHSECQSGVKISEKADYRPIGKYQMESTDKFDVTDITSIYKLADGKDCCFGFNSYGVGFDLISNSRKKAYGLKPKDFNTQRTKSTQPGYAKGGKGYAAMPFKRRRK